MGVQQSTLRQSRSHLHSCSTPDLQSSFQKNTSTSNNNNSNNEQENKNLNVNNSMGNKNNSTTLLRTSRSSSYPNMTAIRENQTDISVVQQQHQYPSSQSTKHDPQNITHDRASSMVFSTSTTSTNMSMDKNESTTDESTSSASSIISPALSAVSSTSSSSSFNKWSCTNCARSFMPSLNDGNDEFCSGDCYWSYMFTIHDHNYGCTCAGSVYDNNCVCYQRYLDSCHDTSIYYDDEYVRYRHERAKLNDSLSVSSNSCASSGLSIAGDSNAKAVPMPTISVVHHPTLAVPAYASGAFLQYAYNAPALAHPYYYPHATRVNA